MCESFPKSPKSQLQEKQSHRNLYKTSPNWTQVYKKKCLSRLNDRRHESRSRLADRFRDIDISDNTSDEANTSVPQIWKLDPKTAVTESTTAVDETMISVWNAFNRELEYPLDSADIADYWQHIREELINEEYDYWQNLVNGRQKEELEWLFTNRESVVCFECRKNPLQLKQLENNTKTEVSCSGCAFKLIVPFPLTLAQIQQRIDKIVSKHEKICNQTWIQFRMFNDPLEPLSSDGPNNMIAFCDFCGINAQLFKDIDS